MLRQISSVVVLVAISTGCSVEPSTPPTTGETEQPLLNAPIDPDHKFDVGVCAKGTKPDGTCAGGRCSGTLIAPNVVLTARHCIYDIAYADPWCDSTFSGPLSPATTLVTTSDSVRVGTPKWYSVQTTLVPTGSGLCDTDLAILILATSVPKSEARAARVDASRDYAKHQPKKVAIVGRGAIAEVMDPYSIDTGDGMRRVLENIPFVCATNDPTKPCSVVDYSSPPSNLFASPPSYFVIGAAVAGGDSGSGVFAQKEFDESDRAVIGVTSAGTFGADNLPNFGLISRLDTHFAFLQAGLRQGAVAAGLWKYAYDYRLY